MQVKNKYNKMIKGKEWSGTNSVELPKLSAKGNHHQSMDFLKESRLFRQASIHEKA